MPTDPSSVPRIPLFGVHVDALRMPEAVAVVRRWLRETNAACRFVVTPNVDHIVLLQENEQLRAAYEHASLVLADGWPVVSASRWLGRPLPERVTGSDLVPELFETATAEEPLTVYLLGAMPGVAERAAEKIHFRWPNVRVTGWYSPPLGFEKSDAENEQILSRIAAAKPDILILGLGAPKQELWIDRHRDLVQAKAALCVGATIDFLAGERQRAPRWMQQLKLEWLYRMAGEPRRLVSRYARDAWVFPQLVWKEWRSSQSQNSEQSA
jgi:N-acetylglucosaminyldiphosphoundecaprenol N-acetyl-beta-D-mannosaminyltransferase